MVIRMKNIKIDLNTPLMEKDVSWQMCVGSGHATMALRRDWCEYVKHLHDELGIRYVRFHGILDDCMLTAQKLSDFIPLPNADKVTEYSFRQVGKVYDNVLSTGMKPFVELSFMPGPLASGKKTGLHYRNNITPPKDYEEWARYIKSFIHYLLNRYGHEEVESWYFEVWNEPDLKVFYTGSQQEYFKFYKVTAQAVKCCDRKLRVGGPSTSGSKWLPEFVDFCEKNNVPCDFISTHQYPGDGFGNDFTISDVFTRYPKIIKTAAKEKKNIASAITALFYDSETVKETPKGIMKEAVIKARQEVGNRLLFYTEWNCMSIFGAPGQDEKYSAAYAVKTILDMEGEVDCFSFWCCNDLFEEIMFINQPFHGGFGMLTNLGIPKPVFWAFKLLADAGPKRFALPVASNKAVETAAFTDGEHVQIFIYAQEPDPTMDEVHTVRLELNRRFTQASVTRIDNEHCNPKRIWQELGNPMDPSPDEVQKIIERSRPVSEELTIQAADKGIALSISLHTNDVLMISLN